MNFNCNFLAPNPLLSPGVCFINRPDTEEANINHAIFTGRQVFTWHDDSSEAMESAKKTKKIYQMVCDWCGPIATPPKRNGPKGHNTLCNACGQIYAKQKRIIARKKAAELRIIRSKMAISSLLNKCSTTGVKPKAKADSHDDDERTEEHFSCPENIV